MTLSRTSWSGIQEAIDWSVEQNINFQRWNLTSDPYGQDPNSPVVVVFEFENPSDAMLFKLTWGGA